MQKAFGNLTVIRKTKGKLPGLPFARIKETILGKEYNLSLVFVNRKNAIRFHKEWKGKSGPVNILSFPLSKNEGEMIISLEQARKECKKFERPYNNYLAFLFIHGCVHLKGYVHGSKMEQVEKKYRKLFGI